jgi:hypothetical protein
MAQTKEAALARAEIYSIFYKFGMCPSKKKGKKMYLSVKKADSEDLGPRALTGAGIGGGIGAATGLAGAASALSRAPLSPGRSIKSTQGKSVVDLLREQLKIVKEPDAKFPSGSVTRLKEVIRRMGVGKALAGVGKVGLAFGAAGGIAGAGAGAGYHALKER